MKVIESQVIYEVSVILDEQEISRLREAWRKQTVVTIPELGWQYFYIEKMESYYFEGAPENFYHLVAKQAYLNRIDPKNGVRIISDDVIPPA